MGVTQTLFAQALARETGLTYTASLAWSTAEVGKLNNLGIMSGGHPVGYPTPAAGAKAAAALIGSSGLYAGIRASVGKSAQAQMDAIARSPWHLGPSGLAAAGGIDPYYVRVFKQFGYVPTAGGGGGGSSGGGGGGAGGSTNPALEKLASIGISTSPSHAFTVDEARLIVEKLYHLKPDGQLGQAAVRSLTGMTVERFASSSSIEANAGNPLDNIPDIPAALAALPGQLAEAAVPVLVNAVPLVLIIVLAYSGLRDLLGEAPV